MVSALFFDLPVGYLCGSLSHLSRTSVRVIRHGRFIGCKLHAIWAFGKVSAIRRGATTAHNLWIRFETLIGRADHATEMRTIGRRTMRPPQSLGLESWRFPR